MTYPHVSGRRATLLQAAVGIANVGQLAELADQVTDAVAEVHNMGTVVTDYGTAIDDLQINRVMPWAVPTVSPLSQTINRRADPTFQLSDLMVPTMSGTDSRGDSVTTAAAMSQGGNVKGRVYYAFLTPAITRVYTQLNFMVGQVTSPCPMDMSIYLVDPATKTMTQQVLKTNVAIPLGESVAVVNFDTFIAPQGSYIAIAWLQRGDGNTRPLLGLNDTPRPLMNNVFPRKISAVHTSGVLTSLPATINGETQVDFQSAWFTPYGELSEDVGVDYKSFIEGWLTVGVAPRPWAALTSPGIYSDAGIARANGFGTQVSIYDTPMSTDYARVRSSVARVGENGNSRSTLIVRCSNDGRSGVGVSAVNNSHYELIEWNNTSVDTDWGTRTVRRSFGSAPSVGDQIEADYLNGLVDVRVNGTQHVTAQAVGGPSGAAGRFVGVQVARIGTIFLAEVSPNLGPWSARDLPQSAGGGGDDGGGDGTG